VFEYDNPNDVDEYFDSKIKEKFSKKFADSRLMIVRADLPQDRGEEKEKIQQKKRIVWQHRVIHKYLKTVGERDGEYKGATHGLILCEQSQWKWQWAILERSTLSYVVGASPLFDGAIAAHAWMTEEIDNL
jgi:hypothetical protein